MPRSPADRVQDRVIAFRQIYVQITGSSDEALMLSQAQYWSNLVKGKWFYKSRAQWEHETGMKRRQQQSARKALVSRGYIQERPGHTGTATEFKINNRIINKAIKDYIDTREKLFNGQAYGPVLPAEVIDIKTKKKITRGTFVQGGMAERTSK